MKKIFYSMSIFALVAMFAACGGSDSKSSEGKANTPFEDGVMLSKKHCECAKLEGRGDLAQLEKCDKEYKAMKQELRDKYRDNDKAGEEFADGRESFHCDE